MPPLQLNDEEMNVLLSLAGPIDHRQRDPAAEGYRQGGAGHRISHEGVAGVLRAASLWG
jgi:hypothetical protein